MTLFNKSGAKYFVALMMLVCSMAQAEVRSPRDGGNHYGPIPGPNDGGNYGPVMPYPPEQGGGDDYGPTQPYPQDPNYGHGRTISQEIYIGRYVRNESIDLLREVSHLRGYRVQSVQVFIDRAREVNSSVDLLVNNRSEDSRRAEVGRAVVLQPRSIVEIGRRVERLEVYARGEMLINRIVVQLASEVSNPPPYDGGNGREIIVPINLPSYMPPQPRLDLTPYIDIRRYRGYSIRGVEITAFATRLNATLDVQLNSFSEGTMYLYPRQSTQTIRSRQNLVIGSSFGNLVLAPRGDSQIVQVNLILSRY